MTDPTDGALSASVRRTLLIGIVVAAALLVLGLALDLVGGTANILAPAVRVPVSSLGTGLVDGNGRSFILLGILVLVITPIVRVLVSFVHFASIRDRPFAFITAFVLAILTIGVLIGLSP
jgi:uncharacterized membrane protein